MKISQVNEAYPSSEVGLRRLGLTGDEIESLRSEQTRLQGRSTLDMILRNANAGDSQGREDAGGQPIGDGQARQTGTERTLVADPNPDTTAAA